MPLEKTEYLNVCNRNAKLFRQRIKAASKKLAKKGLGLKLDEQQHEDVLQEIKLAIWKSKDNYPEGGPDNEEAWLTTLSDRTIDDYLDILGAKKRRRIDVPLWDEDERDEGERTSACPDTHRDAYLVPPVQDDAVEHREASWALDVLRGALPAKHIPAFDAHIDDDDDALRDVGGHRATQAMLRAARRLLGLPADYPADAGVDNAVDHLVTVAQDIASDSMENTCANEASTLPATTSGTTSRTPHMDAGPISQASERSDRSRPLKSRSVRFRRRAPSPSQTTAGRAKVSPGSARAVRPRLPAPASRKRSSKGEPK